MSGPVSIVNSQQTVFSQFHSRGLFLKDRLGFFPRTPAAQGVDTANEPVNSIMNGIRYEATMTASECPCNNRTVSVSKVLTQRSQTYKVFKKIYYVSEVETILRQF